MTENPVGDPTPGAGSPPPAYGAPSAPQYGAPQQPQQPPQYGAPQGFGGVGPMTTSDARMWAMLAHIGGILFGFIAPLIVWLVYKDRDEFVKDQSVEALNFQITVAIVYVVSTVLMIVLIGFLTFFAAWIAAIILGIMAGMAANRGERYRYPFALRLIK